MMEETPVIVPESTDLLVTPRPVTLEEMAINFYSGDRLLQGLFAATDRCISAYKTGKVYRYSFSYPGLGQISYDHTAMLALEKLARTKTVLGLSAMHLNMSLSKTTRLHAIAALFLKVKEKITRLYQGVEKARMLRSEGKSSCVVFVNPFSEIIKTDLNMRMYSGVDLIRIQDMGAARRFTSIFPAHLYFTQQEEEY